MAINETLKDVMKRQGVEYKQLASEINYSTSAVGNYVNGKRKIPKEVFPKLSEQLDDQFLNLELALVATNGASLPPLDGDYIQHNPLSMTSLMQKEAREAIERIDMDVLLIPPQFATETDKQVIDAMIEEQLEAATALVNNVGLLCREYGRSVLNAYQRLHVTMKARKMRK